MIRAGEAAGQGIVEYGLIIGGAALLAFVILVFFGGQLADIVGFITDLIDRGS
jgi:hypothetical protein